MGSLVGLFGDIFKLIHIKLIQLVFFLLVMFVLENSMSRSISSLNLTCDSLIVAFVALNAIGSFLTICLEFDFECVDFDGCEERFV